MFWHRKSPRTLPASNAPDTHRAALSWFREGQASRNHIKSTPTGNQAQATGQAHVGREKLPVAEEGLDDDGYSSTSTLSLANADELFPPLRARRARLDPDLDREIGTFEHSAKARLESTLQNDYEWFRSQLGIAATGTEEIMQAFTRTDPILATLNQFEAILHRNLNKLAEARQFFITDKNKETIDSLIAKLSTLEVQVIKNRQETHQALATLRNQVAQMIKTEQEKFQQECLELKQEFQLWTQGTAGNRKINRNSDHRRQEDEDHTDRKVRKPTSQGNKNQKQVKLSSSWKPPRKGVVKSKPVIEITPLDSSRRLKHVSAKVGSSSTWPAPRRDEDDIEDD
ncbi:uncharacterized protein JCM15063_002225 [Sporobolomyces koalae]|uniref:uncharacterized protein n=1 Tax=Sporobolomyces koalae TaxID=500713 RepID=UPI0031750D41